MKLFKFTAKAPLRPPAAVEDRLTIPLVDALSDAELEALNDLLPWRCFVLDGQGRRFGAPASEAKRNTPQAIPDRRIVMLDDRLGLADKTVLEIGCFEGIHTIALAQRARAVKACDSRIENVVKTQVRCAMFGLSPQVATWNVEEAPPSGFDPQCDVLHHVGVLYHLSDPAAHLRAIAPNVRRAIMLDTHYALPEQATAAYTVAGETYRCYEYGEGGRGDVFSGMYERSRWLLLDDLTRLLRMLGFPKVDLVEDRRERNGARALIVADRQP